MLNKGLDRYFDNAKQQLENGKTLDEIFDEIYDNEKSQTKQEAGIMPKRILPKNIYTKDAKITITKEPTEGEIEIYAEDDGEIDFSCHAGFEGAKDKKKVFCQPKDMKDLMGLE